ncbi:MAG: NapC/NirT family cytochrome c [Deltaproteobacteria bacterium]|nr:NapC/NirT family cytochrome c [Deltaproteobacteria bacterium]
MGNGEGRNRYLFLFMVIGITFITALLFWVGIGKAVKYIDASTDRVEYCTSCHTMEYPYAEFKKSTHYESRSGVSPKCVDCHIPPDSGFTGKLGQILKDTFSKNSNVDEKAWKEMRPKLAKVVREKLLETDSAACRRCHVREAIVSKKAPVMRAHTKIETQKKTCIDCHYNLVHAEVPWGDEDEDEGEAEVKD